MGLDNIPSTFEKTKKPHKAYDGRIEETFQIPTPANSDANRMCKAYTGRDISTVVPRRDTRCRKDAQHTIKEEDRLVAVNRYKWKNLPFGEVTSQYLETLLYYRYKLIAFKLPDTEDNFIITPYAATGLSVYGNPNSATPVPVATGSNGEYEGDWGISKEDYEKQKAFFKDMHFKLIYNEQQLESIDESDYDKCAVPLFDFSRGRASTDIPHAIDADGIIDIESRFIPYVNTAAKNATGIKSILVKGPFAEQEMAHANNAIENAALEGDSFVAVQAEMKTEQLTDGKVGTTSEFMQAQQSIKNFRIERLGVANGGVFEKNAHMLESENEVNQSTSQYILQDGHELRQNFLTIFNKMFGTKMTEEINQDAQPEEPSEDKEEMVGRKPLEDSEKVESEN